MSFATTTDGTQVFHKDWGKGQPVVLSHGWPLQADSWEDQMVFQCDHGFPLDRPRPPWPRAGKPDLVGQRHGQGDATVNKSLTLGGIPAKVSRYRLGNRSALEWVVDQYQVSTDKRSGIVSDPNREDDEQYIVRLVGQVVRVSVETVTIVEALPEAFAMASKTGGDSDG